MAYEFVRASAQTITGTFSISARPWTLFAWTQVDAFTNTVTNSIVTVRNSNSANTTIRFSGNGSNNTTQFITNLTGAATTSGTTTTATNTWLSVAGAEIATNSRSVWLGATRTDNATAIGAGLPVSGFGIGTNHINAGVANFQGKTAEVAIWDVALTDDEIESLSKGFRPTRVRPQNLKLYVPLVRELRDLRGGIALTNNNSATVADHPRVY